MGTEVSMTTTEDIRKWVFESFWEHERNYGEAHHHDAVHNKRDGVLECSLKRKIHAVSIHVIYSTVYFLI